MMNNPQFPALLVHDILEMDGPSLRAFLPSAPSWFQDSSDKKVFAAVRRAPIEEKLIPIGICGTQRNQRFATQIPRTLIQKVVTPPDLLRFNSPHSFQNRPALRSLALLKERWAGLTIPWGPIGSVAFELASGLRRTNARSDLDIVLYAANPFTPGEAKLLFASTLGLPAVADIKVETAYCGFSLPEFAAANSKEILLRTTAGPILEKDPWDPKLMPTAAAGGTPGTKP